MSQYKENKRVEDTTRVELVKEKPVKLPPRPRKQLYEAFLICSDGTRKSLGTMIGNVHENIIGAAYKRAYLLESDPMNVNKIAIKKL